MLKLKKQLGIVLVLSVSACGQDFSMSDLRHAAGGLSQVSVKHLGLDTSEIGSWNTIFVNSNSQDVRGLIYGSNTYPVVKTTGGGTTTLVTNLYGPSFVRAINFSNQTQVPLVFVVQAFSDFIATLNAQNPSNTTTITQVVNALQASQPLFQYVTSIPAPTMGVPNPNTGLSDVDSLLTAMWTSGKVGWTSLRSTDPALNAGPNYAVTTNCLGCHATENWVAGANNASVPVLQVGIRQAFNPADPAWSQGYSRQQIFNAMAAMLSSGCNSSQLQYIPASSPAAQEYCARKALMNEFLQYSQNYTKSLGYPLVLGQGNLNSVVGLTGYILAMFNLWNVGHDFSESSLTDFNYNMEPVLTSVYRPGGIYEPTVEALLKKYYANGVVSIPENRGRTLPGYEWQTNGVDLSVNPFKYDYATMSVGSVVANTGSVNATDAYIHSTFLSTATYIVAPVPDSMSYTHPSDYGFGDLATLEDAVYDRRLYNLNGADLTADAPAVDYYGDAGSAAANTNWAIMENFQQVTFAPGDIATSIQTFSTHCSSCHGAVNSNSPLTAYNEWMPTANPAPSFSNPFVTDVMQDLRTVRGTLPSSLQMSSNLVSGVTVDFGSNGTGPHKIGGLHAANDALARDSAFGDGLPCVQALADLTTAPGSRTGGYQWVNFTAPWIVGQSCGPGCTLPGIYPTLYASATTPNASNDQLYGPAIYTVNNAHPALDSGVTDPTTAAQICKVVQGSLYQGVLVPKSSGVGGVCCWSNYNYLGIEGTTGKIVLTSPAQIAPQGVTTTTPTFSWNAVTGASSYEIQVILGTTIVNDVTVTGTSWTPSVAFAANTGYSWQARTLDASHTPGDWGSIMTFSVGAGGTLSTPTASVPTGVGTSLRPTFTWSSVAAASGYEIKITTGSTTVKDITVDACCSWTPDLTFTPGTAYSWQVRAIEAAYSGSTTGSWSTSLSFTPIATPTPSAPFAWSPVSGAASYEIMLTSNGALVQDATVAACCTFIPSANLTVGASYTWLVRALTSSGDTGKWSAAQTFSALATPTANAVSPNPTGLQPTFTWSQVTGATSYEIRVIKSGVAVLDVTVANCCSWTSVPALPGNSAYTWTVRALTSSATGNWSSAPSFITIGAPTGSGPVGSGISVRPIFSWTAVTGAIQYELQVAQSGAVVYDGSVSTTGWMPYTPLIPSNTYSWAVRAIYASGITGGWSPTLTFATGQLVFITPASYSGYLGGLAGADSACQSQAAGGGLGGRWMAVLSDDHTSANVRLVIQNNVYDVAGRPISAGGAGGFWSSTLSNTIALGPNGATVANAYAWTGSDSYGNAEPGQTCSSWSSPVAPAGMAGVNAYTTRYWLSAGDLTCNRPAQLYCISQ